MLVQFDGSLADIIRWQRRRIVLYAAVAVFVVLVHDVVHFEWLEIPSWPMAVIGSVLGIFVSFRSQAAYGRWWEGRILWGRLVNISRGLTTQVQTYVQGEDKGGPQRILRRHICYIHILRCVLRGQDPLKDPEVAREMDDELLALVSRAPNPTYAVVHAQMAAVVALADEGRIDPFRLQSLNESFVEILAVQGGCERIRNTPLPRIYHFVTEYLIHAYGLLLPLALVHELFWAAVPANILVCMSFMLVGEISRELEDPFSLSAPALPLHAISRNIERDVRHRLGEPELPQVDTPDAQGILM